MVLWRSDSPWRPRLAWILFLALVVAIASPAVAGQSIALELLGRDADRVSRAETAEPDGYTDVHFRVKVQFPHPVTIRSIDLHRAGEGDRPVDDYGYGTVDPAEELLLVERAGERVNEGFTSRLTEIDREATLDLYIGDNGTLDVGSRVLVEIALEDGGTLRRAFTVGPAAGRLLGEWNVHCDASSLTAFEPMTLSGRLWLDLGEDGRVTGEVNGIPLTGTATGDSIRVTGESPQGRASLWGELTRPRGRSGRPGASGWLEYQPTDLRCGSGPWSTD